MCQKAQDIDRMECGLNGRKIVYEVIKRWLHIIRVIKGVG